MTNLPNAPETSVEAPEKENKKSKNVRWLLKSALERKFGVPLDPEKFDAYKKKTDTLEEDIQTEMRILQSENLEDWWDITEDMIEKEAKNKVIFEMINQLWKDLVLKRKRLKQHILDMYPQVTWERNYETLLDVEISRLNTDQLNTNIMKRRQLEVFVKEVFPDMTNMSSKHKKDFEDIFFDRSEYTSEDQKKRLEKIFLDYKKFNQVPDTWDIRFILDIYKNASNDRKKEILTKLGTQFSLKWAYDLGFIDDDFIATFAEREFHEFYSKLATDRQKIFCKSIANSTSIAIVPTDFTQNDFTDIFSHPKKRELLASEISRSFHSENLDGKFWGSTILSEIRRENKLQADNEGRIEDFNAHEAFIEKLGKTLNAKWLSIDTESIEKLKYPDSVIELPTNEGSEKKYIRLVRFEDNQWFPIETIGGQEYGIELQWLYESDWTLRRDAKFVTSYDTFYQTILSLGKFSVHSKSEFESRVTVDKTEANTNNKILDLWDFEDSSVTPANIAYKLDDIDHAGRWYGFEEGTCFIAPSHAEDGSTRQEEIWRVQKIHDDRVDLMDSYGGTLVKWLSLAQVYEVCKESPWFRRIAKIQNDRDMIKELANFQVSSDANIEDWKLIQEFKDEHGHKEKKTITCFNWEKWGHIRIESIENGVVNFGEFTEKEELSKLKAYAEKNGLDNNIKWQYDWKRLSYPAFIEYLKKNSLKATNKDLILPDARHHLQHDDDHHHAPHAHMESSLIKRMFQWQNPASLWKWLEMVWHGIEHTLEKWAKLDAARFAMKTANMLHLPDGVSAQIYADIVNGSKEIVEKYEQKIFWLPGPRGREKCIHIVHNKDSRPEEVAAAMSYMLKSYWHLYAEDIKHYQPIVNKKNLETADPGYFAFFDAFVLTSKIGNLKEWRIKAYKRAITEMGTEDDHENEPTEEQLLHALFKNIDGDWEQYPYAASVMKALGWPSGFEKIWKFEGFDNAMKKWKEQSQMVNAQGRLNKAISYFKTNEIYKAIGAMEAVAAKDKDPKFQVMPIIWACGGFSRYASHTALQKIKWYAENGYSFHAYAFLRNQESNEIYRETFRLALKEQGGQSLVDEFDGICREFEFHSDKPKATHDAAKKMMDFWQKHYHKGLHAMLQGQNWWLTKEAKKGNKTVEEYIKKLSGAHMMQLNDDKIPSGDLGSDWYVEHGYMNMIHARTSDGMASLKRMLNKITFEGTAPSGGRPMKQEHYEKIWYYVKDYMNDGVKGLKNVEFFWGDRELQKQQYLVHRKEIIDYFSQKLNTKVLFAREGKDGVEKAMNIMARNIKDFPYYKDLADMGIDPRALFDPNLLEQSEDEDYQRWLTGGRNIDKLYSGEQKIINLFRKTQWETNKATINTDSQPFVDPDRMYSGGGSVDKEEYEEGS